MARATRRRELIAPLPPGDLENGNAAIQNVVVYGNQRPAAGAAPVTPNLKPENVQVSWVEGESGAPRAVDVSIVHYSVGAMFGSFTSIIGPWRSSPSSAATRLRSASHEGGTGPARLFEPLRTHDCSAEPGSVVQATLSRSGRRGQSLVEATLVLFVFLALLLGVADCGQVLFAHQALVERARAAVALGRACIPWQGPQPIVNLVLYGQTQQPASRRRLSRHDAGQRPGGVSARHAGPPR